MKHMLDTIDGFVSDWAYAINDLSDQILLNCRAFLTKYERRIGHHLVDSQAQFIPTA